MSDKENKLQVLDREGLIKYDALLKTEIAEHTENNDIHVTSDDKTKISLAYEHAGNAHAPVNAEPNEIVSIKKNGTTLPIDASRAVDIVVPTKLSEFENDANFLSNASMENLITEHNVNAEAHADIRALIDDVNEWLEVVLDSDDETLNQMSEIVAYIKSNKSLIESITTSKVNVSDIIDNLTTNVSSKVLSAAQGVAIKALIDALDAELEALTTTVGNKADKTHTHNYAGSATVGGDAYNALKFQNMGLYNANNEAFTAIPYVGADGVMEIGKHLDFHVSAPSGVDHDARITARTDGLTLAGLTLGTFQGNLTGTASKATLADTASKVAKAISINGKSYDGSAAVDVGTLGLAYGGTGATTAPEVLTNLGLTATAAELNYIDGVTRNVQTQLNEKFNKTGGNISGSVNIENGANYIHLSISRLKNNKTHTAALLPSSDDGSTILTHQTDGVIDNQLTLAPTATYLDKPLAVNSGGTGASDAAVARANLGITPDNIGAAKSSHIHSIENITNLQSSLDGKASVSHNHDASNITSGTLASDRLPTVPVNKGGTGATTALAAQYNLLHSLNESTSTITDTTQFVFKYASPASDTGAIYYRNGSYVWNYIASKITANSISTPTLTLTSTSGVSHLAFSRPSYNYITAPTSGSISFVVNGKELGAATSSMTIKDNNIFPGATNLINLGTSDYKWKGVYATTFYGDLSGNATTASQVYVTTTNPTTATTYCLPFHFTETGNKTLYTNTGIKYKTLEGTTSAVGMSQLILGNNIASGTAGNKAGTIALYGNSSAYTNIVPANTTSSISINLPSTSGTLALTSNTVGTSGASTKTGQLTISCSGARVALTDGTNNIWVGINANGDTWGIYDVVKSQYLIQANSSSVTLNGNATSSTNTYVAINNPSSETTGYLALITGTSAGNKQINQNNYLRTAFKHGTTSVDGYHYLILGNSTGSGTAGNYYGCLRLYSRSTGYIDLMPASTTGSAQLILPSTAGTLALTSGTVQKATTLALSNGTADAARPVIFQDSGLSTSVLTACYDSDFTYNPSKNILYAGHINPYNSVGKESYILYPSGGSYVTNTNAHTGYLKITLPVSWTSTMLRFRVSIYNYVAGTMCDYFVGGYNYNSGTSSAWHQCTAYSTGRYDSALSNLPVTFGHDGSKCAITIGNADTSWSYVQVQISEVQCGYSNYTYSSWYNGWGISFTTTALNNKTTYNNPHVSSNVGNAATASQAYVTTTNPTTGTTYYPTFASNAGGTTYALRANNGIKYYTLEGTTSAVGLAQLGLGNNVASGTAGNKTGAIYIYGNSSGYTQINPSNHTTSNITITLPSSGGTLARTVDNVASANRLYLQATATSCTAQGLHIITAGGAAVGNTVDYSADTPNTYSSSVCYGTILRVKYGNTSVYYNDVWFDANSSNVYFKTVTNGTSKGWQRMLTNGNYSSYALPLSAGASYPLTSALYFKTNSWTGDIIARNASNQPRYEMFSGSNSGAIAPFYVRVFNNEAGTTYVNYTFGTDGTLTATTFSGSLSGTATQANAIYSTANNPSSETRFYPFMNASSGEAYKTAYINTSISYAIKHGTASAAGYNYLILGNGTASGTAGNYYGVVRYYSTSSGYCDLRYTASTSSVTNYLPATAGTLLNTGTTSFTQSLTSGTAVGTIKINGTSTTLYAPTNTDSKVSQGRTTTSSYRPLLMHYVYGDYGTDVGSATNASYYHETIAACPYTGEIKATKFVSTYAGVGGFQVTHGTADATCGFQATRSDLSVNARFGISSSGNVGIWGTSAGGMQPLIYRKPTDASDTTYIGGRVVMANAYGTSAPPTTGTLTKGMVYFQIIS